MHNCTHFSPCTGPLTIFQKSATDSVIICTTITKNPPSTRGETCPRSHYTCMSVKPAQNITFIPLCLEHPKDSYWLKANVASMHGCLLHQDVHCQGPILSCFVALFCYFLICFISPPPPPHYPNIN
jgi:hypothetical protein